MKIFSLERWLPHWHKLAYPAYALVLGLPMAAYTATLQITRSQISALIVSGIVGTLYLYPVARFYWVQILMSMTSSETVLLRRKVFRLARRCREHRSAGFTIPVGRRVVCVDLDYRVRGCVFITRTQPLPKWEVNTSGRTLTESTTYFIWKGVAISCWHRTPIWIDIVQGKVNPKPCSMLDVTLSAPRLPIGRRRRSAQTVSVRELRTLAVLLQQYLDTDAPQPRQR
jgi:hypothetical protein